MTSASLIIRGGTLVDGTGSPPREADVALHGERIIEVARPGKLTTPTDGSTREIDARDKLVTPGFVDPHTHYDAQVTWASQITPSSNNGVTTVVMGNCGVGFAPVRDHQRDMLISLMEGVEDIPEVVLSEGLSWRWRSFEDYLDELQGRRFDVDVAAQVPHAALRVFVMGERGANREPAKDADRTQMAELAARGVAAGAFGFSTSRLLQHRTAHGEPIPSYGAAEQELMQIAQAIGNANKGWLQVVADFGDALDAEFSMLERLAKASGRPLTLTLLQRNGSPDEWREILRRIKAANAAGARMTGQVRGRPTSTLLGFELSENPFIACPSWQEVAGLAFDARLARLREPAFRARLLAEPGGSAYQIKRLREWSNIFALGDPPDYEPPADQSIASRAERAGVAPEALAYDLMLEREGRAILYHPMTNYVGGNMDCVYEMLRDPDTIHGLGDGGAHVGIMCDATDMTHALTFWSRDRTRGPKLSIEHMVARITRRNALAVGFTDRGLIAPGMKADLNVMDFDRLRLHEPQIHYDLPAGGKRLLQKADGYEATILSGQPVWRQGEATGLFPGRLLRS